MEGRVFRMAAFFDEAFRSLLARTYLYELRLLVGVMLAKMGAKPALSIVYLKRDVAPFVTRR